MRPISPNRVIDQRPALRVAAEDALREARRRLQNLVNAIEAGSGTSSLFEAVRQREAEIASLQAQLSSLAEPLEQKLAVMPVWVRQQLEDTVGLLSDTPERSKAIFAQLGLSFVMLPERTEDGRAYLRAEGTSDLANVISGQCLPCSTTDATHLRRDASRTSARKKTVMNFEGPHYSPIRMIR
jgi:hypothetical protein